MSNDRRRWRQVNLQGLMILTVLCATFAAGYRSGEEHSDEFAFDELMRLIETTVIPDTWETLGGPSTLAPYPTILPAPPGCFADVVDHTNEKREADWSEVGSTRELEQ